MSTGQKENTKCLGLRVVFWIGLAILTCYTTTAMAERGVTDETINVGIMQDITGPIASTCVPIVQGAKMALEYTNSKGGTHGRKFNIFVSDDSYKAPVAIAEFKRLVNDEHIFALLGPGGTPQLVALKPLVQETRIPHISIPASPQAGNPPMRYTFNILNSREREVAVLFDYIFHDLKKKDPRIGIIYPDNEYGKAGLRAARERANFYNTKLVDEQVLNFGATDAASQVLQMKRSNPEFVVVYHVAENIALVLKDAKRYGLKATFMGIMEGTRDDLIEFAGDAASSYMGTAQFASWDDNSPGMKEMRKAVNQFEPNVKRKGTYFTLGWVNAIFFAKTCQKVGRNLSAEKLVDTIENFKSEDITEGLISPVTFGPNLREGGNGVKLFRADVGEKRMVEIGSGWRMPAQVP